MRFTKKMTLPLITFPLISVFTLALWAAQVVASKTDDKIPSQSELASEPWMNKSLSAEKRTELVLAQMSLDEKLSLVFGYFGKDMPSHNDYVRPPESYVQSAGFIFGVPRLGIPHLWETDAGQGVASQAGPHPREATALPSGLSTAATWNPKVGYAGGVMIGSEARAYGFNVMLAGGVNIIREPRAGRNFEYAGEDPFLAGVMVGEQIRGIQSNGIVSTLKHFALNDQETSRFYVNIIIDDTAARMSDLLALQIAYEIGDPGSVMCAYNRVNGIYACESEYLLNEVLKGDWGFKGWVMSDWGAAHSTIPAANSGLDQQSGASFDRSPYFNLALKEAVLNGWVSQQRMDDMTGRILYPMFKHGLIDHPVSRATASKESIDFKANAQVTQRGAEEGMVLLKNDNARLPLANRSQKIAVIGGHADVGVLAGGGSSLVYPVGGMAVQGIEPLWWPGPVMYYPSSPLKEIKALAPKAKVRFDSGNDITSASALAADSDVVIIFATQWTAESVDVPDLSLPNNQDALIAAVAKANPNTVVVLETGGPVVMPWLNQVDAVLEAWYPGTRGGQAIARILFGEVNPSGHLPLTFPASLAQLPRPTIKSHPDAEARFDEHYHEGAAVGYKWFDLKKHQALFPFGHGLSYTDFTYSDLSAQMKNGQLTVNFTVKNSGSVAGKDVAQVYVSPTKTKWEAPKRLAAFEKVDLKPGETKSVSVSVDPRLLAMYKSENKTWKVSKQKINVILATSAATPISQVSIRVPTKKLDVNGK